MFKIEIRPCLESTVESLLHEISVVRMNSLKYQLQRWLDRSIVFKDIVGFIGPENFSTRNVKAETARVAYALPLSQESLTTLQLLMCFPALINIRDQVIPTDDTAFRVSYWKAAYVEPAVNTIGAADTVFNVVRIPGFYRAVPPRHHHLAFIRMYKRTPIGQLLKGPARIIQDSLIDEFDFASRSHRA